LSGIDLSAVGNPLVRDLDTQPRLGLALGSGADGLDATRTVLERAAEHLTENGLLIVEIGHNRDALEAAYPDLPFTWLDVSAGDEYVFLLHRNDLV